MQQYRTLTHYTVILLVLGLSQLTPQSGTNILVRCHTQCHTNRTHTQTTHKQTFLSQRHPHNTTTLPLHNLNKPNHTTTTPHAISLSRSLILCFSVTRSVGLSVSQSVSVSQSLSLSASQSLSLSASQSLSLSSLSSLSQSLSLSSNCSQPLHKQRDSTSQQRNSVTGPLHKQRNIVTAPLHKQKNSVRDHFTNRSRKAVTE